MVLNSIFRLEDNIKKSASTSQVNYTINYFYNLLDEITNEDEYILDDYITVITNIEPLIKEKTTLELLEKFKKKTYRTFIKIVLSQIEDDYTYNYALKRYEKYPFFKTLRFNATYKMCKLILKDFNKISKRKIEKIEEYLNILKSNKQAYDEISEYVHYFKGKEYFYNKYNRDLQLAKKYLKLCNNHFKNKADVILELIVEEENEILLEIERNKEKLRLEQERKRLEEESLEAKRILKAIEEEKKKKENIKKALATDDIKYNQYYCRNCGSLLNEQSQFTENLGFWYCLKCSYKNYLGKDNMLSINQQKLQDIKKKINSKNNTLNTNEQILNQNTNKTPIEYQRLKNKFGSNLNFYHITTVENAISIIKTKHLFSRSLAEKLNVLAYNNITNNEITAGVMSSNHSSQIKKFVRFYMNPLNAATYAFKKDFEHKRTFGVIFSINFSLFYKYTGGIIITNQNAHYLTDKDLDLNKFNLTNKYNIKNINLNSFDFEKIFSKYDPFDNISTKNYQKAEVLIYEKLPLACITHIYFSCENEYNIFMNRLSLEDRKLIRDICVICPTLFWRY